MGFDSCNEPAIVIHAQTNRFPTRRPSRVAQTCSFMSMPPSDCYTVPGRASLVSRTTSDLFGQPRQTIRPSVHPSPCFHMQQWCWSFWGPSPRSPASGALHTILHASARLLVPVSTQHSQSVTSGSSALVLEHGDTARVHMVQTVSLRALQCLISFNFRCADPLLSQQLAVHNVRLAVGLGYAMQSLRIDVLAARLAQP